MKARAAKLTITDNLIVREIDDKSVEQGFLSKNQVFKLVQGQHALVVKYKDVFEDLEFAEDRLVKSDYFVVKFTVENQQELLLMTSEINDLATAERFVKSPELRLVDEHQQDVVLELEKLSDYALAKQVTKVVNTLSTPTVMSQINSKTTTNTENEQAFTSQVINSVDTVPMLKYWWQKANKGEKDEFIDFINKNKELK
ncbi:DUF2057 domain-containing protein [Colwellia sp. 12G3]|nr:DUF2057 domain-containing protein [Colwellia sp. 12G3]